MFYNKKKLLLYVIFIIFFLNMNCLASAASTGTVRFPDVPANYWAAKAVSWGVEHQILDGYEDGTFKPDKKVSEAEFLKMLISAYVPLPPQGNHWFDGYYTYAYEKGWYVRGLKDETQVQQPLLRKDVAILLSSALGKTYKSDDPSTSDTAITDLYDHNISHGKTSRTVAGFAPNDTLSRAEAVQFVYNFVVNSGIQYLKASVAESDWTPYEKVTFDNEEGILDKHKLFSKKYGLKVITYQLNGQHFMNMVPQRKTTASNDLSKDLFDFSSSYKKDTDGTIHWTFVANLDREDPWTAYEFLSKMFSYDAHLKDFIIKKLIPVVKEKGIKSSGKFSVDVDHVKLSAMYNEKSNHYYLFATIAPLSGEVNLNE